MGFQVFTYQKELNDIWSRLGDADKVSQLAEWRLRKTFRRGAKVFHKIAAEEYQLLKGRATEGNQAESRHVELVHVLKVEEGEPVALLPHQPVHPIAVEVAGKQLQLLQVGKAVERGDEVAEVLVHIEVDLTCVWAHPHKQLQLFITHVPAKIELKTSSKMN